MEIKNGVLQGLFLIISVVVIFFSSLSNSFAQDRSISGTISLPDSVIANDDIDIGLFVENVDKDGFILERLGSVLVVIEEGSSQVDFQLSVNEPGFRSDLVQVKISCFLNCDAADGDMMTSYFLQDDGSFAPLENNFAFDNILSSVDFQYPALARLTIRGTITLPDALLSRSTGIGVSVFLDEKDENALPGDELSAFESISIRSNVGQADFEVTILQPEPDAQFSLSIRCSTNCNDVDGRTSTQFFLQADGTFDDIYAQTAAGELPSQINFKFPPLVFQTVTGTISLPDGMVADKTIFLDVSLIDPEAFFPERFIAQADFLNIQENTSNISYSLSFREPHPSKVAELIITCEVFCEATGSLASQKFYLQDDGSFGLKANQIRVSDLAETIDFQFPAVPVFDTESIFPAILFLLLGEEQ